MAGELTVQTSPVGRMITALCDRLLALPELGGVGVYSAAVNQKDSPTSWFETVQIWDADEDQSPGAVGIRRQNHEWTVRGVVMAIRQTGDVEADIRAARDRCYELLALIERELRSTDLGAVMADLNGNPTSRLSRVRTASLDQGSDPDRGRWCSIVWTIGNVASTVTIA